MIRYVEELKHDNTGAAYFMVADITHEGIYHKCPDSGDVEIKFVEPPLGVLGVLILQDGNNSTYRGQIGPDGRFSR